MKYLFLALAGAADQSVAALGGRTPLEVARTPMLDRLASRGLVGQVYPLHEGAAFSAGAVSMALMGCDPNRYYQGQGPLEAAAARVTLGSRDVVFSLSFVTTDGTTLLDPVPPVTADEMRQLMEALGSRLNSATFDFYAGVGARGLLRWRGGDRDVGTIAPTRLTVGALSPQLPQGDGAEQLQSLMFDSMDLLDPHPVNRQRRDEGKPLLSTFWPWGQGEAVALPSLFSRSGHTGVALTHNPIIRGLATATGMYVADDRSSVGDSADAFSTDSPALLAALDTGIDLAFFHTLAPAQAAQSGDAERKVHVLEQIDSKIVGPLVDGLQKRGERFRLLATPVHATITETGLHNAEPVPFLWYDSTQESNNILPWQERVLPDTRVTIAEGYRLLERLWK